MSACITRCATNCPTYPQRRSYRAPPHVLPVFVKLLTLFRGFKQALRPRHHSIDAETQLLHRGMTRCRRAKPVESDHIAMPPDVLPPAQRRTRLNRHLRQVIVEDRVLILLRLFVKDLPAWHRDDPSR